MTFHCFNILNVVLSSLNMGFHFLQTITFFSYLDFTWCPNIIDTFDFRRRSNHKVAPPQRIRYGSQLKRRIPEGLKRSQNTFFFEGKITPV